MEDNKVLEVAEEVVNEAPVEEVLDGAEKILDDAVKTGTNPWSIVLLVLAGLGLIASGAWIFVLVWWIVKKVKAAKAAKTVEESVDEKDSSEDTIE